jgi:tRNA threonylcarbamoyladenosine biosynthesis protein TsaB
MTRLLALDSSTEQLAVAVAAGDARWTRVVEGGAQASARVLPLALEGLAACGIGVRQLDAVAFGVGPGAFTGLRCACAVAQGLAFGARIPVVAVDSLLLVAEDARVALSLGKGAAPVLESRATLWVAMDARMDEAYAACYRHDGVRWHVIEAPALYTLDALAARWREQPPQIVAGSAVQAFAGRLPFGAALTRAAADDRAAALLRVALQRHGDGATVDAAHAMPLYLRDKVALTTAERAAARAGGDASRG